MSNIFEENNVVPQKLLRDEEKEPLNDLQTEIYNIKIILIFLDILFFLYKISKFNQIPLNVANHISSSYYLLTKKKIDCPLCCVNCHNNFSAHTSSSRLFAFFPPAICQQHLPSDTKETHLTKNTNTLNEVYLSTYIINERKKKSLHASTKKITKFIKRVKRPSISPLKHIILLIHIFILVIALTYCFNGLVFHILRHLCDIEKNKLAQMKDIVVGAINKWQSGFNWDMQAEGNAFLKQVEEKAAFEVKDFEILKTYFSGS